MAVSNPDCDDTRQERYEEMIRGRRQERERAERLKRIWGMPGYDPLEYVDEENDEDEH